MEKYLKMLIELNLRLLKRLASEDVEMLKEIIALENGMKYTREEPPVIDLTVESKPSATKEKVAPTFSSTDELAEPLPQTKKKLDPNDLPF